jgi:hypothetical protein
MSTIRENYEQINSKFKSQKENLDSCLLIEIFDEKEQDIFFIKELESVTRKLFELMESKDINNDSTLFNTRIFLTIFFITLCLFT